MRKTLQVSFLLSVLLPCVSCDQATKSAAKGLLMTPGQISLLHGFIRFEYAENPGAFLSLGARLPGALRFLVFVILTGTMLAAVLVLALKVSGGNPVKLNGLGLAAGGGVSNLVDRLLNDGRVIDFISLGVGQARTGIFNVADVAIMAGAALLLYGSLRGRVKTPGDA